MDIWIIRDCEKIGPIHDYEVRRKIELGELPASTPAWHAGLSAWQPLIEIDLFTREFEMAATPAPPEPEIPSIGARTTPPPLPEKPRYFRRFCARWFDLILYSGVWWIGMWACRQNIEFALLNPWVMFLHYVPWFALEALLIQHYGTTPGKWLLGLHVVNKDGSRLDLAAAISRALRVMFTGVGFGWGLLAVFCQALSLFTAKRLGVTLWDYSGGHRVTAEPLHPLRLVALIFLFFGAAQLHTLVLPPANDPALIEKIDQQLPGFKSMYESMYEDSLRWHLPKRY